jgi:hypothetical protein
MRTAAAVAAFLLVSGVTFARAQEAPAPAPAAAEIEDGGGDEAVDEQAPPRRHIQVLQHPYEISSFYRSSQSSAPVGFGYEPAMTDGKYPIAGFYRSGASSRGAYSAFWTTGYAGYGVGRQRGRGLFGARRPRALGLNGDLCLFAPTFLAPVGPLTGVFFDR